MSWQSKVMPDDALNDCLVGTMLQSDGGNCKPASNQGQVRSSGEVDPALAVVPQSPTAEQIENVAKIVYEWMRWACINPQPDWQEGGNSIAQYEARRCARQILERISATTAPVPVSDALRWQSLRARFHQILCAARSQRSRAPVGNIELATRLIDAVWAELARSNG